MDMSYKRVFLVVAAVAAPIVLVGAGFYGGFNFGKSTPEVVIVKGIVNTDTPPRVGVDFEEFWRVWKIIDNEYLKADGVDNKERLYGSIRGMVGALDDPYTVFLPPEASQKFAEDIQGSFGGVGIEIGIRKDQLVVIAPLKDTPGFLSGIKAGDRIVKINSTSTEGMTTDDAVRLIRGPEGTTVALSILRENWNEPREFKITRARITVPTLDFSVKEGNIGYLQLYSFNPNARYLFRDAIRELENNKARGLVLDLRDNPGGFLEVAIDLAGWFLEKGDVIVSEAYRGDRKENFLATGDGALRDIPVVILLNKGSASASEILAGALRDNRKIKIIGEQSFGKGTVQEVKRLSNGSSLKITIAHWVLPNGDVLEGKGLKPDIEIKIEDGEEFEKGSNKDRQLNKALEVLKTLLQ